MKQRFRELIYFSKIPCLISGKSRIQAKRPAFYYKFQVGNEVRKVSWNQDVTVRGFGV
jgi:hypothetical protein